MKFDKKKLGLINRREVINVIRKSGRIYSAEIARITGLSIPTVMKITEEFVNGGLICECGKGESTGGKPPKIYEFVKEAYFSIGVDIGRTNITVALIDLSGAVVKRKAMPTGDTSPPALFIEKVIALISDIISDSQLSNEKLLGIGVGMAGIIDSTRGVVVFSPDFGWCNYDILSPIKSRFQQQVVVENSTRAKALAEKWFGAASNEEDFVCLNLGYGIAAALMMNGELYYGNSGYSGEFGHLTLMKNGPLCDCGNSGCLEAIASGNAIAKSMRNCIESGCKTRVLEFTPNKLKQEIDAKAVFDAAKYGDTAAEAIIVNALDYIGIGLAGLINIIDPSIVILSGGIVKNGSTVINRIEKSILKHSMKAAEKSVRLVISELGDDCTAIGAAGVLIKSLVENGGKMS